jgi:hypothetical protein
MKTYIALSLVALMTAAALAVAPALGQPESRTQLIALDGKSVDKMQLRHDFNAVWVIDERNILYRDDTRDYYLVTLKEACAPITIRSRSFDFHPSWTWQLQASRAYEVRPEGGSRCDVAKIEQLDDVKANPIRDASLWRVW